MRFGNSLVTQVVLQRASVLVSISSGFKEAFKFTKRETIKQEKWGWQEREHPSADTNKSLYWFYKTVCLSPWKIHA